MPAARFLRALLALTLLPMPAVSSMPMAGAQQPDGQTAWYLAEGTTREGFDEFILVFNPNPFAVTVGVRYLVDAAQGPAPDPRTFVLTAQSRIDLLPFEEQRRGIDHGTLVLGSEPIFVERALYLDHGFPNAGQVNGATAVFGVNALETQWSFAEGTTLPGFDTFYLLSNPGTSPVTVSYSLGVSDGAVVQGGAAIAAGSRVTLRADELVGAGKEGVSAFFSSTAGFLAERSVYFSAGTIAGSMPVDGAHAESGAQPSTSWSFAEGTVLPGWYEFLTLGNPGISAIQVTLSYQFEGSGGPQKTVSVPARGRRTVQVFDATDPGGVGRDVSDPRSRGVAVRASSGSPFVMERPLYFAEVDLPRQAGVNDGHVSKGISGEPARAYAFAEGTTLTDFDTFLTFQNPNSSDTSLSVSYYTDLGTVVLRSLVVPAGRRVTTQTWNPAEVGNGALGLTGRGFGVVIASTNGVSFLVERPVYEVHSFPGIATSINGGTDVAGLPLSGSLTLSLSADRTEALLGETVAYKVDVTNAGLRPAEGASASVRLPDGFAFRGAVPAGGCEAGGSFVTCDLGEIGTGIARSVVISATVGGAPVTAVARAAAAGAGLAPGRAAVSIVVAETTLGIDVTDTAVTLSNTGMTTARHVVLEDDLPDGAVAGPAQECSAPPEAGGKVVCLVETLAAGEMFTLSWSGGTGQNVAEAKGDNTTRAASAAASVVAHAPSPVALTGTTEGFTRSFHAVEGVRLRPDSAGGGPAIESLPALSAEVVGGEVNVEVTPALSSTVSASWVESDGTRFDISSTVVTDTSPSQAYYQSGGVRFDTRQHGSTARPDGPGSIPDQFAQVAVRGVGTLTRTDGRDGATATITGAGFTVALRHGISDGADLPWQRWAEPGSPAAGETNYGGGFTAAAGLDLVHLVIDWDICPNIWSGSFCPVLEGVPARSIVFTSVVATAGFQLAGL